jgi:diacylglycerol kinase family enzyme
MGARIAPAARLDDGLLDVCVVGDRAVLARFWHVRHLALASIERAPNVLYRRIRRATVAADGQLEYHVDGEPGIAGGPLEVRVLPGALRVNA